VRENFGMFLISVQGAVTCMKEEGVIQPLLVVTSAIRLAAETVAMILKIDDIILVRGF
jgi:T-complex protein 1 subunit delta